MVVVGEEHAEHRVRPVRASPRRTALPHASKWPPLPNPATCFGRPASVWPESGVRALQDVWSGSTGTCQLGTPACVLPACPARQPCSLRRAACSNYRLPACDRQPLSTRNGVVLPARNRDPMASFNDLAAAVCCLTAIRSRKLQASLESSGSCAALHRVLQHGLGRNPHQADTPKQRMPDSNSLRNCRSSTD